MTANAVQRAMQRLASRRPVAFIFRHTFHHVDRAVLPVLRGRTLSSILAGVPNVMLTTTGARRGRPCVVPLIGLDVGGALAVVGTRFGSPHQPGWYHNLRHEPRAVVERAGRRTPVVARLVPPGAEYDAVMRLADATYLGFPHYRRRITARQVPVFVLEPDPTGRD